MPDTNPADGQLFPVRPEIAAHAHVTAERYREMYERAARDPDGFWAEQARRVAWMQAPTKIKNASYSGRVAIKWFEDGVLNASVSCLDRHAAAHPDRAAIIWESDDPSVSRTITYRSCTSRSAGSPTACARWASKKGDRITIYLPMVPEAAVAMLACARIGAVHSVVFGGFSPDSLANRLIRLRVHPADHRRRGPPRRAQGAAQGERGRGAEILPRGEDRGGGEGDRRRRADGGRARPRLRRALRRRRAGLRPPSRWARRTRCSSSIPPAAPASRRACCTPPAATWSGRPSRMKSCSTTARARSTGAPPMSAGSPGTPTSSTARSRTAPPR